MRWGSFREDDGEGGRKKFRQSLKIFLTFQKTFFKKLFDFFDVFQNYLFLPKLLNKIFQ